MYVVSACNYGLEAAPPALMVAYREVAKTVIVPSCHRVDESCGVNFANNLSELLLGEGLSPQLTPAFVVDDLP